MYSCVQKQLLHAISALFCNISMFQMVLCWLTSVNFGFKNVAQKWVSVIVEQWHDYFYLTPWTRRATYNPMILYDSVRMGKSRTARLEANKALICQAAIIMSTKSTCRLSLVHSTHITWSKIYELHFKINSWVARRQPWLQTSLLWELMLNELDENQNTVNLNIKTALVDM